MQGLLITSGMLANASDLAIASEEATFGMLEISFGVYPALVGPTTQLATLKKAVSFMVLTGESISAHEAKSFGLVNTIVPNRSVLAEAQKWAKIFLNSIRVVWHLVKKHLIGILTIQKSVNLELISRLKRMRKFN